MSTQAVRKSRTSSAVKQKYNKKTYDVLSVRIPKDMSSSFKKKCIIDGIAQAQIVKLAIQKYLDD